MPTYFTRPLTLLEAVRAARVIALVRLTPLESDTSFKGFDARRFDARIVKTLKDDRPSRLSRLALVVLRGRDSEEGVERPRRSAVINFKGSDALLFAVRYDGRQDRREGAETLYTPYLGAMLPIGNDAVKGAGAVDLGRRGAVAVDDVESEIRRLVRRQRAEDRRIAAEAPKLPKPAEAQELEPPEDALRGRPVRGGRRIAPEKARPRGKKPS